MCSPCVVLHVTTRTTLRRRVAKAVAVARIFFSVAPHIESYRFVKAFRIMHGDMNVRAVMYFLFAHFFMPICLISALTIDLLRRQKERRKKNTLTQKRQFEIFDLDLARCLVPPHRFVHTWIRRVCLRAGKVSLSSNTFITHSTSRTESARDSHSSAWKRLDIIIDRENLA